MYFCHSFFFFLAVRFCYFFTIQTEIDWFTPKYSKVPSFACFRWLFWCTPRTLKLLYQVEPQLFHWLSMVMRAVLLFRFSLSFTVNTRIKYILKTKLECLIRDQGVADSSLTGVTALSSWARHTKPSLALVQQRKTRPYISKKLLMGRKKSNKTNEKTKEIINIFFVFLDIYNKM